MPTSQWSCVHLTPKRSGPVPTGPPGKEYRKCLSFTEPSKVAPAPGTLACRPASTTPGPTGRSLPPRPRQARPTAWTFPVEGLVAQPTPGLGTRSAPCRSPPTRGHPLRHHLVQAGHDLRGVSVDTLLESPGRWPGHLRAGLLAHRLHHQPPPGRCQRWPGLGGLGGGGRTPAREHGGPARLLSPTSTSGRAPNGWPGCGCWTMTSPGSGSGTATTIAATPGSSSATKATEPGLAWEPAPVVAIEDETASAKTFSAPALRARRPTSPGSTTCSGSPPRTATPRSRSYSVASAPDGSAEIELTVERLDGGEVSRFLHDEVRVRRRARGTRPHRRLVRLAGRDARPC